MAKKGKILKLATKKGSSVSANLAELEDFDIDEEDLDIDDLDDFDLDDEDFDDDDIDDEDFLDGYVDDEDLYGYEEEYRSRKTRKKARPKASRAATTVLCLFILTVLGSGGALGYFFYNQQVQSELIQEMLTVLEVNTFYKGITVDGVDVSGMTLVAAKQAWREKMAEQRENFRLTVTADNKEFVVDDVMANVQDNADTVLEQAFYMNRNGSLAQRYQNLTQLEKEGRAFETGLDYNLEPVRNNIIDFCESFVKAPENAEVTGFDFDSKIFQIKKEKDGRIPKTVDAANAAIALLEAGNFGESVPLEFDVDPAQVTETFLSGRLGLVSSFKTKAKSDSNRNTNIKLASRAVKGTVLQPGDVFSFNNTTGERTRDKGYKAAGAINDGVMVDETGGGVCQVSSTLFNAVVRADLEIVDRHPHSWPSSYVHEGEDAAVDYPYTDFQFRNSTDAAIYVWMHFEDRYVYAEIYGIKLEDGITIDLESEKTKTYSKPSPKVKVNKSWPEGKKRTVKNSRGGSSWQTYKIILKDGVEISREKFYKTSYRAIRGLIEVGPNTKA